MGEENELSLFQSSPHASMQWWMQIEKQPFAIGFVADRIRLQGEEGEALEEVGWGRW